MMKSREKTDDQIKIEDRLSYQDRTDPDQILIKSR